ncbi:glycerophosphodiester phosphodiesterase [Novosphingobium mangrovi (ex Huang et al. 2023)]|uniref:Glycerophosphodiester phosphodiesterase family protein n=1 Tax=Novosphingobium mangrovi (ex Huang et al. 2023) TaxID=2976432 RepID=A0ABT2I8M5_9SPHN|nr:glycerophosphodiester phosphodiesterase family protein [Novosphingobium mangrovi (ex Huang et al. 2023)]MCT2401169.1 glycerophosphodiester phosphodiesterase family protein [Novosphingobium mangrovi (ex Huang et al. 2023)]
MSMDVISRRKVLAAMAAGPLLLGARGAIATAAKQPAKPYLIAHRGGVVSPEHPENSMGALKEAIRRGYTHVEVDLRCTRDGHVVCLHDRNLMRTTGLDLMVDEVSLQELHRHVRPDIVPTFDVFARTSAAGKLGLMVDIKEVPAPLLPAFSKGIETSLERHGLLAGALLIGHGPAMARIHGPVRTKWRKPFAQFESEILAKGGDPAHYFAFDHPHDFTPEDIAGFRRHGVDVIVTVNLLHYPTTDPIIQGQRDLAYAASLGVDGYQIDADYETYVQSIMASAL